MSKKFFVYLLPAEDQNFLDFAAVDLIFKRSTFATFEDKQVILSIGSNNKLLYHIIRGNVSCTSATGHVLVKLSAGEIFGENSFIDSSNRGAGAIVQAEGKVECMLLSSEALEYIARLNPRAGARFARGLAIIAGFRLRHVTDMIRSRQSMWAPKNVVKSDEQHPHPGGVAETSSSTSDEYDEAGLKHPGARAGHPVNTYRRTLDPIISVPVSSEGSPVGRFVAPSQAASELSLDQFRFGSGDPEGLGSFREADGEKAELPFRSDSISGNENAAAVMASWFGGNDAAASLAGEGNLTGESSGEHSQQWQC